jgi:SAM-dependent methyltransferase
VRVAGEAVHRSTGCTSLAPRAPSGACCARLAARRGGRDLPSIYDYPLYYDVLFSWNREAAAETYGAPLRRHGAPARGRILEIACGTGQIAVRLARRGWQVTGLDLSQGMLDLLQSRAAEAGVTLAELRADMTSFELGEPREGAYNPLSSFRLLPHDGAAVSHLEAVAQALAPGAPYVLDLIFGTSGEGADVDAEWTMRRGPVEVHAGIRSIRVADGRTGVRLELDWGRDLRAYTPEAFARVVEASRLLLLSACYPEAGHDAEGISRFDLDHPLPAPVDGRALVVLTREDRGGG